jgi:RHS repeat-associated protein
MGLTENKYRFAGEQFDDTLNQYYLRARYYDQAIGRFASQDSWQGNDQDPVTLHKYAYANLDPANAVDSSGHMAGFAESGAVFRINAIFATMAAPTYSGAILRVGAGLIAGGLAYGLSQEYKEFISKNAPAMSRILEEKRTREEARVATRADGRNVLYHYTDRGSALAISTYGVGISSPGYGSGRPPGFYASNISPWDSSYTQEDLSALFYGGSRSHDVSWFVAINGDSFVKYPYNGHEWYSPSATGEVNLEIITIGPNLMLPK